MTPERWQQIDKVLQAALERPQDQRAGFLDKECAGDEALRKEIESLIGFHERATSFMEDPLLDVAALRALAQNPAGPGPAGPGEVDKGLIGSDISHYRVLEKLGGGGMGVVYKAQDVKLPRYVALKFLPEHLGQDRQALERFRREADAASALNHPNICTIYDIDEYDGRPFIVMEFLEGQTLKSKLETRNSKLGHHPPGAGLSTAAGQVAQPTREGNKSGAQRPPQGPALSAGKGVALQTDVLLDLAVQIADALDTAHAKEIIHRDIKPANIFVTSRNQVKILDFGIAKLTGGLKQAAAAPAGDSVPTARWKGEETPANVVIGTVAYMSPEQARGEEIDSRTDLFSFGAVLYEMTCGQPAFVGNSIPLIFDAILNRAPTPVATVNAEVPPRLAEIVSKALEKDRRRRFQTASEMRADLQRLKRETDLAREASSPNRRSVRLARLTKVLMAVAILIAVLVIGERTRDWIWPPAPPRIMLAVLPLEDLSGDSKQEYLADGLTDEMITELGRLHPEGLGVIARSSVMPYRHTSKSTAQIGKELGVNYILEGSVSRSADRLRVRAQLIQVQDQTHVWADEYDRNLTDVLAMESDVAKAIARQIQLRLTEQERTRLERVRSVSPDAYESYIKGRYHWNKRTPAEILLSVTYFKQAIQKDPGYAVAHAGLADAYLLLGSVPNDVLPPRQAMPQSKEAAQRALRLDEGLAEAHVSLAYIDFAYDWNWLDGEKEFQRALELNPNYATGHEWYALSLVAAGRTDAAMAEIDLAKKLDPLSPVIYAAAAQIDWYTHRYDEALEQCRTAFELYPDFFLAHYFQGRAYEQKGMVTEAIGEFQKASTLSGGNPTMMMALGHAYAISGRKKEARELLARLVSLSKEKYVPAVYMMGIAAGLDDKDGAFHWLNQAVEDRCDYVVYLRQEPGLENLRSDPRFAEVMKGIGLSQ